MEYGKDSATGGASPNCLTCLAGAERQACICTAAEKFLKNTKTALIPHWAELYSSPRPVRSPPQPDKTDSTGKECSLMPGLLLSAFPYHQALVVHAFDCCNQTHTHNQIWQFAARFSLPATMSRLWKYLKWT